MRLQISGKDAASSLPATPASKAAGSPCGWQAKARVRGYALDPSSDPNFFAAASIAEVVDDDRGDIRDYPKLEASLVDFQPEVVFHLAAQPLLRRSYADPLGTYSTNVMGTANLLEAVRKSPGVRAVLCVTTDKCYQNREWVAIPRK